ncbi:DUF1599 domain-containing protein [Candidatus Dojkabacteria bacterium]|jgi:hypothetical protein|nr:DUF1599 domain-containing protein [Candidatus Dojkabacteria bacterium]
MIKREDWFNTLEQNFAIGMEIMKKKNADFSGEFNPVKNFEGAELAGVTVERVILVRIVDKISRISTLFDKQETVKDETIQDTLIDLMNYTNILSTYIKLKK